MIVLWTEANGLMHENVENVCRRIDIPACQFYDFYYKFDIFGTQIYVPGVHSDKVDPRIFASGTDMV